MQGGEWYRIEDWGQIDVSFFHDWTKKVQSESKESAVMTYSPQYQ